MCRHAFALVLGLALCGCSNPQHQSPTTPLTEREIPQAKVATGIKLARIQEKQNHLHKALEIYESLLQTDPNNAEVCHRLVVVYSRLDQPQQADAYFQKTQSLKPDHPELLADYGYACYLRGDLDLAETWLRKAHQLHPKDDRITGNLALILGIQGRQQESLTCYRKFLDEAEANANLGYALTQRGDFGAARERYAKALSLDPQLKAAQHALLQLAEQEQNQETGQKNRTARKTEAWQATGRAKT